jgi:RNA polymerase sigma-70 factor (ECF subfamily)
MPIDEFSLVNELQNAATKKAAFKALMDTYQQQLYSVIRKMLINHDDTNDVLQNTFIKVWNKIGDFNQEASLFTWMYRIAVNEALQHMRKRKREMHNQENYNASLIESLSTNNLISGEEIQLLLQKAIINLPEKQKLVFNLRYFEDLPYQQIHEITGSAIGTLKATYHQAVNKIEKYLSNQ